jgi:hypothetical protein
MTYIEPRVSEAAARRFFQRRPGTLWGLLGPGRLRASDANQPKPLPHLELIWIPYFLVPIHVRSRRGPGTIHVSVEAHSGAFAVFQMHENLVEGTPRGEAFTPKVDAEEAKRIGRQELLRTIMRRRGQREKPVIEDADEPSVFYYPYWVYYYERRRGRLDIRLCDALTREKGGTRTKAGVLSAFMAADSARNPGART